MCRDGGPVRRGRDRHDLQPAHPRLRAGTGYGRELHPACHKGVIVIGDSDRDAIGRHRFTLTHHAFHDQSSPLRPRRHVRRHGAGSRAAPSTAMREARGLPPLPLAATRPVTSLGARGLLGVGFGMTPGARRTTRAMRAEFLELYERNICARDAPLSRAWPSCSTASRRAGSRWGIVTNKAERLARLLLEQARHGAARALHRRRRHAPAHLKPHPAPLLAACRAAGHRAARRASTSATTSATSRPGAPRA